MTFTARQSNSFVGCCIQAKIPYGNVARPSPLIFSIFLYQISWKRVQSISETTSHKTHLACDQDLKSEACPTHTTPAPSHVQLAGTHIYTIQHLLSFSRRYLVPWSSCWSSVEHYFCTLGRRDFARELPGVSLRRSFGLQPVALNFWQRDCESTTGPRLTGQSCPKRPDKENSCLFVSFILI